MNRIFTCMSVASLLAAAATAQVNYSETFSANAGGWVSSGGFSPGWISVGACSGGCLKSNLYQTGTSANFVSPSLGTSLGGSTTVTFDYRIFDYTTGYVPSAPPSLPPFGTVNVQWGNTAAGPWTTIGSFTNEAQTAACINKSFTFTPAAGALYVRLNCVYVSPPAEDDWWNFDNVSVVEVSGGCSGTPAPGNTVGPTDACPSSNFTLSLQNSTSGSGVSYQWEYGPTNIGPWLPLGTAATQVANQVMDTWYRCSVTCGSNTGISTPALVPMAVTTFAQDFATGTVTPNCWSISNPVGTFLPTYNAGSAFGVGVGMAGFNFYNASNTFQLVLTSPSFAAVGAGTQVYFDAAGATYNGGEIDHILLEESNDGGTTWTLVVDMDNAPGGVGVLNTGGIPTSPFVPTASQWTSLAYPLTAGSNRIRFRGVSNFGNYVYLDNISVGVLPSARHTSYGTSCVTPAYTLSASPAPVSGPTLVTFSQTGIPEAAPASGIYFGVVVLSLSQIQPGVPLTVLTAGAIDSPCNLNVGSLDLLISFVSAVNSDASATFTIPAAVPAGTLLYSQAAALIVPVAPNNAGIVTSNAVRSYINSF